MDNDKAYFARRAAEERAAAERTSDPRVKGIHLELADEYERRCAIAKASEPPPPKAA